MTRSLVGLLLLIAACGDTNSPASAGKVRVTARVAAARTPSGDACSVEWTARIRPAGSTVTYSTSAFITGFPGSTQGGGEFTGSYTDSLLHHWTIPGTPEYVTVSWHVTRDTTLDRAEGWSMGCWTGTGSTETSWEEP